MSRQFSPGARGHRPSKTDASIFPRVVTSHDCHFTELWLSNTANPGGRGRKNKSVISLLTPIQFLNSFPPLSPPNEVIGLQITQWGTLMVLPWDNGHNWLKVLPQLMCDQTLSHHWEPKEGQMWTVGWVSRAPLLLLCLPIDVLGYFFVVSVPCTTQHEFLCLRMWMEIGQACSIHEHKHMTRRFLGNRNTIKAIWRIP